jgi:alpha-beta hydrolase superfamily lysophospholipase
MRAPTAWSTRPAAAPLRKTRPTHRPSSGTVTARCFDGLYHEIFNEIDSEPVFDTLKAWLDARF